MRWEVARRQGQAQEWLEFIWGGQLGIAFGSGTGVMGVGTSGSFGWEGIDRGIGFM